MKDRCMFVSWQDPPGFCAFTVLAGCCTSKLKKTKTTKQLIGTQMIHAAQPRMNFVQWNAIDYCPKVID